jgi:hypothetical protein
MLISGFGNKPARSARRRHDRASFQRDDGSDACTLAPCAPHACEPQARVSLV